MKAPSRIAAVAVAAALAGVPAAAFAHAGPHGNQGKSNAAPGHTKAPKTHKNGKTTPTAYGRYCQGESKQHVAGQSGTDFSRCVTDMAREAKNPKLNPHRACANESKKHVAGHKGTPYSVCVSGAERLIKSHA